MLTFKISLLNVEKIYSIQKSSYIVITANSSVSIKLAIFGQTKNCCHFCPNLMVAGRSSEVVVYSRWSEGQV